MFLEYFLLIIVILQLVLLVFSFHKSKKEKQTLTVLYEKKLDSIIQITETLRSSLELDKVFIEILNIFSKKFGYEKVFIYLIEEPEQKISFRCIACPGMVSIEGISIYSFEISDKTHPIFELIQNNKNISLEDVIYNEIKNKIKLKEIFFLPIIFKNKIEGFIVTERISTNIDMLPLKIFANECGVALENAKLYTKIQEISITDPLTGVYNRRYFDQRFLEELELAKRYKSYLTLCLLDIDDFKNYNDTNGHIAGDVCLKKVANIISTTLRSGDTVFRYGGEEFVFLLPATNKEGSFIACERIRKNIENSDIEFKETQPLGKVTVSIGFAVYPIDAYDSISLIKVADENLYKAKKSGKNRVCFNN